MTQRQQEFALVMRMDEYQKMITDNGQSIWFINILVSQFIFQYWEVIYRYQAIKIDFLYQKMIYQYQ